MQLFSEFLNESKDETKIIRNVIKKEFDLTSRDVKTKLPYNEYINFEIKTVKAMLFFRKLKNLSKTIGKTLYDELNDKDYLTNKIDIFVTFDQLFQRKIENFVGDKIEDEMIKTPHKDISLYDLYTIRVNSDGVQLDQHGKAVRTRRDNAHTIFRFLQKDEDDSEKLLLKIAKDMK